MNKRPAIFWSAYEDGIVSCSLCPHSCKIPDGSAGFCGVRENIGGKLYAMGYGRVSSIALDPVEKKPLYRFHPGRNVLSIGGFGCNMRCPFCQNCEISMEHDETRQNARIFTPEQINGLARQTVSENNIGVAYTYNEPLIGYEFLYDCARLVRDAGLKNVVVTNGYISREPLEALLPLIDAMNIDLKGFSDRFYQELSGGLEAVKETIAIARERCHVEITTLIIPGENENDVVELARWIASLDPEIPLHLSRFFPRYRYSDRAPTPRETILKLRDEAGKFLTNVFVGNM